MRKLLYRSALAHPSVEGRFTRIYDYNLWYSNKETKSGAGSTIIATNSIRKELPVVLKDLGCSNIIDIGCGDFNWQREINFPCNYLGIDIVKEIVKTNKEKYSHKSGISFKHMNAIEQDLPTGYDSAICREVLFHLSFEDGLSILTNIKNSGINFLLATTSIKINENKNIKSGKFRNINLSKSPYNLPDPILLIPDDFIGKDRFLAVFDLSI